MSRLGKKPILIPQEVEVKLEDGVLNFKGKQGTFVLRVLPYIETELKDGQLSFDIVEENRQAKANLGTIASLARNAIEGVSKGFVKNLRLEGVGFKVSMEGKNLILNVGFSHPVKFESPEDVTISVDKNTIKVEGVSKALVGEAAAQIRRIKKPEPYKGKGIRYEDEVVRRKAGKKAVGTTG